ncbi:uncharacterized protein F4807DRAFT_434053 [Annulohypoxylon truncatum]|uniref:uncharacterized protein n=1 Tax=Annulohypoxylon truncatum TaxID=327061 RepID=UPI002007DD8A|nr:uncharacterized protein F4807DRAFT_434053 [Annulohypoxylon truncatum]KAI1207656.1 hypothetical protein F4807DRAFT_434053 [Annulohypoxylon truncatum]
MSPCPVLKKKKIFINIIFSLNFLLLDQYDNMTDQPPRQCFLPRCRLCRFLIFEGESVKAITQHGIISTEFFYNDHMNSVDITPKLNPYRCTNSMCHHRDRLIGCHSACLSFVSPVSLSWLQVTDYSFEPAEPEDERRLVHFVKVVATKLTATYNMLPLELWRMISSSLAHEFAASATYQTCATDHAPNTYSIDTTLSIWARFVRLDGIQYIGGLSNTRQNDEDICIFNADKGFPLEALYVSEDHLGIRWIISTKQGSSTDLPATNDDLTMWWQTIHPASSRFLTVEYDGFKLRHIFASDTPKPLQLNLWSTPMPPLALKSLHFHSLTSSIPPINESARLTKFRMASFECNNKAITGLSGCWASHMLYFHAHVKDDNSFYRRMDLRKSDAIWIYVPLDRDESIATVWWRMGQLPPHCALVVKTDKNRLVEMGPHTRRSWPSPTWSRMFATSGRPARIYWEYSHHGSKQWATSSPPDQTTIPSVSTISQYPPGSDGLFYSSASLENIVEIIPCQRKHICSTDLQITGLLIHYKDKTRACVGGFRMDSLCPAIRVGDSSKLYLGFTYADGKYPCLVKVEASPPEDEGPYQWLNFSWEGRMEWWHDRVRCQISCAGKCSPKVD